MANEIARHLRKTMTPQEIKLWVQRCYLKQDGFYFRRQVPIGHCIVDFAEKMHRLVIEIDGSQHAEEPGLSADKVRHNFLASAGYRVLRFWNTEVDTYMDGVISAITAALAQQTTFRKKAGAP